MKYKEFFTEDMKACFGDYGIAEKMTEELNKLKFFELPASIHHHGTEKGDLAAHSYTVTNQLLYLTKNLELKWELERSPYLVGWLHDLCKCDNYVHSQHDEETVVVTEKWEYNNASILTGHGEKSVIMAQKLLAPFIGALTDEEIACIRWHMGAFDDREYWNNYGQAVTQYPNVLFTHTADMIAARIVGI